MTAPQEWITYQINVLALDEADRAKANRLVREFVSLCKANNLTVNHSATPVSGHRRGSQHGRGARS
jgi:hypothetical protein